MSSRAVDTRAYERWSRDRRQGGSWRSRGQRSSGSRCERIRADTPSLLLLIPVTNIPSYVGRVWKTA